MKVSMREGGVSPSRNIKAGNLAMRISRACLVALLLALSSLLLGRAAAHAASLDDALAISPPTISARPAPVSATSRPAAVRAPRSLFARCRTAGCCSAPSEKTVYVKDETGKLTDAATGVPIAGDAPADIDTVRVNNRLRGAVDAALGGLTLSPRIPARATRPRKQSSSRAKRACWRRSTARSPRNKTPA